jgi:acyl-CoA thioesterase
MDEAGVANPFAELIGLRFSAALEGRSECALDITPSLLNPNGVVHGAVVYALADTGMGGALVSALGAGQTCATVEIKISYLRAATAGTLTCAARVLQKGQRIAFLEAQVFNDGRLMATASGTFVVSADGS